MKKRVTRACTQTEILRRYSCKRSQAIIIGYVLLIVLAIVISIIVYKQLKSFVPRDVEECDEGVSLMSEFYVYDCTNNKLILILKNNGRFNINGFSIKAGKGETEIATIEIGNNQEGILIEQEKEVTITQSVTNDFTFLEIIPYVEKNGEKLICSNARIRENIECLTGCKDSDGGINLYKKGFAYGKRMIIEDLVKKEDYCFTGNLYEAYCSGEYADDFPSNPCPTGYSCSNGVCVSS